MFLINLLPKELIKEVITRIDDKIYVSMVCKLWIEILNEIFIDLNCIEKVNCNDSYSLKICNRSNSPIIKLINIYSITNKNSLSLIVSLTSQLYPSVHQSAIERYIEIDTEINYTIKKGLKHYLRGSYYYSDLPKKIFINCLLHKSYNILIFMLLHEKGVSNWLSSRNAYYNMADIDTIIKELEFVRENGLIPLPTLLKYVINMKEFKLKNDIINYLSQHVSQNILKMIIV